MSGITAERASHVAGEVHGAGLRIVEREDGVDVRRSLERGALAGEEADRPALAEVVHLRVRRRVAEEVCVRDARQVDAARAREAVPLPEARVDLHQPEAAVARVTLELDLREPEVVERLSSRSAASTASWAQTRLADTTRPDAARRRLPQLASGEDAERAAVAREVAPDRVQRVVAAGYVVLDDRSELFGLRKRVFELRLRSRSGTLVACSAA